MNPEVGGDPAGTGLLRTSIVIPVRGMESAIGALVRAVLDQDDPGGVEVLVVVDGTSELTATAAERAGARVVRREDDGGNPAAARNLGAQRATGDLLVFLDADCTPVPGWLQAHRSLHREGERAVGGSFSMPEGLSISARCDYYCGWYHVHPRRSPGYVVSHPPGNFSIRRSLFEESPGFVESQPVAYAHEELALQAWLAARGVPIRFEPRATVHHRNRSGFGNLMRRSFRWGFSAIEAKRDTGAARFAGLYRHPALLALAAPPLSIALTAYAVGLWARAGRLEPVLLLPAVFAAKAAYSAGLMAGGLRLLRWGRAGERLPEERARWE